jgi:hypothetical protein
MSESYLEKCVQALPREKQAAAREAIRAIAENGEDNLLSKLLVTLEATSAYAESIPQAMVANGEKFLRELDARTVRAADQQEKIEVQREARLRQLITEQVPQLGKTLALDKIVARLDAQSAEIGRFARSAERLRHARVGGLVLLMTLGALLGAGATVGLFWKRYDSAQRAQRFVSLLNAAGVDAEFRREGETVHFTVEGPVVLRGTAWRKDAQGYTTGADFVFPTGGGR